MAIQPAGTRLTPLSVGSLLLTVTLQTVWSTSQVTVSPRSTHILLRDGYRPECVSAALALCQETCTPSPPSPPAEENTNHSHTAHDDPLHLQPGEIPAPFVPRGRRRRHCQDLKDEGDEGSGVREVFPFRCCPDWGVQVFCDQDTDGGGWTVFQRRKDIVPRQDFYRTWVEYQQGFGNHTQEFWLGLDLLHELSTFGLQELRVDLGDCEGDTRHALYGFFHVADSTDGYRMHCGRYSGDAGDNLSYHSGQKFSTHDKDQDGHKSNCASTYLGAWWYKSCHNVNLNGKFLGGQTDMTSKGIVWDLFRGHSYSLCFSEMKMRPSGWGNGSTPQGR